MTWFLLSLCFYIPALWVLYRILQWDSRGRTLLSYVVLLVYGCALAAAGPMTIFTYALMHAPKSCTCEMVKNHECIQK